MNITHKRVFHFLLLGIFIIAYSKNGNAQLEQEQPRKKIAIFAPLYLDSAYNSEGKYRLTSFPKLLNPGLEFYEGAKFAIDSLKNEDVRLAFYFFDTKAKNKTVSGVLNTSLFDSIDLIITHCNAAEARVFAEHALKKNTPVINANLPSDAGAISNPFWVVINPTLRTQCEGVYKLLQKHYSLDPIVVFRKNGNLEDRIKMYLDEYGKNTAGVKLPLKFVDITDSTSVEEIKSHLDTTLTTTCIAGSLDEGFGNKILTHLVKLYSEGYKSTIIGMPTWDAMQLSKPDYKGPEVLYSNPFYNAKIDKTSKELSTAYNKALKGRPTDMVYRGYETTLRFTKLLCKYDADFASNLSNKQYKVFTDFDIQPVLNKQSMDLDYFENKKLSFLKWQDGVLKTIY